MKRSDICSLMTLPPQLPAAVMHGARLMADRRQALVDFLKPGGDLVEVGTMTGAFAKFLLQVFKPQRLIAMDISGWAIRQCNMSTRLALKGVDTRLECLHGTSQKLVGNLHDSAHDLLYIDADHEYSGVCADLEAARQKVRVGGLMVLNDYYFFETDFLAKSGRWGVYGVMHAANEFLLRYAPDWEVVYYALGRGGNGGDLGMRRIR